MGIEEIERIKQKFAVLHLYPVYREHAPAITSEDASKHRGDAPKQGIKALLFTDDKNEFIIVNVPADKKVDSKKVAQAMNWSKSAIRMATPEEVMERTGCEIGAVPPFGHRHSLSLLIDTGIYENEESAFNIGLRTISVKIPTKEMKIVFQNENASEGSFTKESA